jgi:hypothetical protein
MDYLSQKNQEASNMVFLLGEQLGGGWWAETKVSHYTLLHFLKHIIYY